MVLLWQDKNSLSVFLRVARMTTQVNTSTFFIRLVYNGDLKADGQAASLWIQFHAQWLPKLQWKRGLKEINLSAASVIIQ